MYQSLIWSFVSGNDSRRLRPPFDPKDRECLADPLVDGVRRDVELRRDFLRRQELVDEPQAIQLRRSQASDAPRHGICSAQFRVFNGRAARAVRFVQSDTHPAKHAAIPRQRVHDATYVILGT
jgi:hypothetical protein